MYTRQGSKRAVETFLVASGNQALTNTANADSHLINQSTGSVRLADGQLGIVDASGNGTKSMMEIVTATDTNITAATSPAIQIVQGTSASANPAQAQASATFPLWARPFEASQPIHANGTITATKQAPVNASHSTWAIGKGAGNAGDFIPTAETEYAIRITYRGRTMDEMYSQGGTAHFTPHFTTPDFAALSITTDAHKRDYLIQNLVWNINRNSTAIAINRTQFRGNDPVVAFAIDTTGAAGDNIGGKGSGATQLAAGDVVPVVESSTYGTRSLTLTQEMVDSIKDTAIAASGDAIADTTWSIVKVDLSTAGTDTNGVADAIMIMALDRPLAYQDFIPQTKIRLDVGLTSGFNFNTVYHAEGSKASEGEGQGRALKLWYDSTHGQRKYNLQSTLDPIVNFPNPVDEDTSYNVYVIEHHTTKQIDTSNMSASPKREVILIPSAGSTTVSEFDTAMNSWLASINQALIEL